tara:strand:+ start:101 stop:982 length:882 start_codon:yes stop_codon:yes gene_type:complete
MTTSIFNGNCLELMKTLPDKSIDLFICDLPYGETNCKWDSIIDLDEFWAEFRRLRKSKRVACIHFCSTKFGYTIIKSWEKGFKMDMVWKKRNKTGGLQSRHRPMRNHEMVYFFYEQAPKYNRDKYHKRIQPVKKQNIEKEEKDEFGWDKSVVKELGTKYNGANFHPVQPASVVEEDAESNKIWGYDKPDTFTISKNGTNQTFSPPNPASVFDSQKVFIGKRHHQTEKPLDILEFFLKYWSDEGDTILDPTMGSGSTGVACKELGRNFIGYELDPKIFEVAKERLGIQEEVVEI